MPLIAVSIVLFAMGPLRPDPAFYPDTKPIEPQPK